MARLLFTPEGRPDLRGLRPVCFVLLAFFFRLAPEGRPDLRGLRLVAICIDRLFGDHSGRTPRFEGIETLPSFETTNLTLAPEGRPDLRGLRRPLSHPKYAVPDYTPEGRPDLRGLRHGIPATSLRQVSLHSGRTPRFEGIET